VNIARLLFRSGRVHCARPAVGRGVVLDYGALSARVASLAASLRDRCGIRGGDRVVLWMAFLHLDNSSRHIANQHLHGQMRRLESIPTLEQVLFSNDLDVLLGEVVRRLRQGHG
jgi:hypothetical protein